MVFTKEQVGKLRKLRMFAEIVDIMEELCESYSLDDETDRESAAAAIALALEERGYVHVEDIGRNGL